MAIGNETFNNELYQLLKVRGYKPTPLNSQNQRVKASQEADVIEFEFTKDGEDYGKVWVSIDDASNVRVYFDDEQAESPSNTTPGAEYDDTWTGLLKHLKKWAQRRQLSFELANKDRLGDDMRQRDYYKMKEKLGESMQLDELSPDTMKSYKDKATAQRKAEIHKTLDKTNPASVRDAAMHTQGKRARGIFKADKKLGTFKDPNWSKGDDNAWIKRDARLGLAEGYHPMGKKASYNNAVPNVKIVLQHNRALEEGEARFRNVARIYLENVEGERFLAPTNKPGLARVYTRHIAEGGVPNDEKWNHIKSICEEYQQMAGFVRATRKGQFNESAQQLVNEGINHYNNLRETLHKLAGHRGYHAYFESYTPALMEDDTDTSINELFVQETMDPRIESVMPILSRLHKKVSEGSKVNVDALAEWADGVISEKLELDAKQPEDKPAEKAKDKDHQELIDFYTKKYGAKDGRKKADNVYAAQQKKKVRTPASDDHSDYNPGDTKLQKYEKKANKKLSKKRIAAEGEVIPFKKKHDEEDWDDDSWIPSVDDFEQEEKIRNREPKAANDLAEMEKDLYQGRRHDPRKGPKGPDKTAKAIPAKKAAKDAGKILNKAFKGELEEDLGPEQKRVGQLGPTEKVKDNNIGKLVGASESKEMDPELARIIEMAKFKR